MNPCVPLWMAVLRLHPLMRSVASTPGRVAAWYRFCRDFSRYRKLAPRGQQPRLRHLLPCLGDDTAETPIEPTYFYQNAWAFEHIANARPTQHVDVGSHHMFIALLSKITELTMIDLRPLAFPMPSIHFKRGSILDLPFEDASLPSVSSICVVEHIGLGRYGDPLDPEGSVKAITELKRVLAPGGRLYVSVPLDDVTKVYFNAHRAFNERDLKGLFEPLVIEDSRYIYNGQFGSTPGAGFGIGCYLLRRPLG